MTNSSANIMVSAVGDDGDAGDNQRGNGFPGYRSVVKAFLLAKKWCDSHHRPEFGREQTFLEW